MAWTDFYTEEELARARGMDEFGMGTNMAPGGNLFGEVQSSQSTTGSGAQFLQPTFESLGRYIEENPAEAAMMGLTFIPGVGWVARGAMSGYKAIKGSRAIDKLLRSGKTAAESLTSKKVPLLSKGTGKTPKGEQLVNTQGQKMTTRQFSPARTAATAGAVTLGLNEISKQPGQTSLFGQKQPGVSNVNVSTRNTNKMGLNGETPTIPYTEESVPLEAAGTNRFKMNFSALGPLAAELQRAGTPLRYRKDMPTGQDVRLKNLKAQTDAMTAQAALGKSGMTNFYKNVNASEIPPSVLTKMFMPEFGGWFGISKEQAEALANQRAATFISKRGEMVSAGKNPTMKEVLDALKEELNK